MQTLTAQAARIPDVLREVRKRSVQLGGKDRVVVVDDEAILVIGGHDFAQLLESPGGGRMGCRAQVNQSTRTMFHHHQHVEDA
jgi:hypothetical protein